jgi:hypothetical protein
MPNTGRHCVQSGFRRRMQLLRSACVCFFTLAMGPLAAVAQGAAEAPKAALPAVTACPPAVAEIATCYSEQLGSGGFVLAAMPKAWNGN